MKLACEDVAIMALQLHYRRKKVRNSMDSDVGELLVFVGLNLVISRSLRNLRDRHEAAVGRSLLCDHRHLV